MLLQKAPPSHSGANSEGRRLVEKSRIGEKTYNVALALAMVSGFRSAAVSGSSSRLQVGRDCFRHGGCF